MASNPPSGNQGMWDNVDPFAEDGNEGSSQDVPSSGALQAPASNQQPDGVNVGDDTSSPNVAAPLDNTAAPDDTTAAPDAAPVLEDTLAPLDSKAPDDTSGEEQHAHFASQSTRQPSGLASLDAGDSSSSTHKDDGLLDKLRTHADDVADGFVEKVRSVAHRFVVDNEKSSRIGGFNPTKIRMHVRYVDEDKETGEQRTDKELAVLWRARDNRKGRNSIAVPLTPTVSKPAGYRPKLTSSLSEVGKNLWRMLTVFAYWDMAFWGGWSYTIGSALFVLSGAFAFSPLVNPAATFPNEDTYASDFCFLFGALLYQVGAVIAYLECINYGSWHGGAMQRLLDNHDEDPKKYFDHKMIDFFHDHTPHWHRILHMHGDEEQEAGQNQPHIDPYAGWNTKHRRSLRPGSIYPTGKAPAPRRDALDFGIDEGGNASTYERWRWWPTWKVLWKHHLKDLGYVACTIQLFGVTLFGVTAIVVWPLTFDSMATWQVLAAYEVPQIVASACFLTASVMFMLETQSKWWKPEPKVIGWWIGVWSFIGSVGFELCAVFGTIDLYIDGTWADYQAELSSTWGSFAYMIGGFLQWYEALNKNPVEEILNEPGALKSWQVHAL